MLLLLLLQLSCFSRVRLCATPEMAPTRLPHPWDSPGKNAGVGCHFLLQCMKAKSESEVVQSCPTPSDPMDCSLPGSSVHGIFQARVLEWGAIAFSGRSSIQSAKIRLRADCGSDHELLITKFRLKLKEVGKPARPFRYDLNQIPYNYTVEMRNRFKGLDLIDRVPDELCNEVRDIVQETGIKTIPMEKKCKKAKWLSGEALQIAVKRREAKSQGEKERY